MTGTIGRGCDLFLRGGKLHPASPGHGLANFVQYLLTQAVRRERQQFPVFLSNVLPVERAEFAGCLPEVVIEAFIRQLFQARLQLLPERIQCVMFLFQVVDQFGSLE